MIHPLAFFTARRAGSFLNVYAVAAEWDVLELGQYYEKALDATRRAAQKFRR